MSHVVTLVPEAPAPALVDLSDDDLMLLSAASDTRAFAVLVRRHEQGVRRFLSRLIGSADAPDLCQECFVKLWTVRARYRAEGRFTVFLYRVAKNLAFSKLRWRRVRRLLSFDADDAPPISANEPDGLDTALARERRRETNLLLAQLKPELRLVLVLRHGEGLDYASIASITGISEENARARAHRGLCWLKAEMQKRAPATTTTTTTATATAEAVLRAGGER